MAIKAILHIEAPVEKVFDFFKDPSNYRPPRGQIKDVRLTQDGVGTNYTWTFMMAGMRMEGFSVFTEFVRNQRITEKASAPWMGTWTYSFEPEGTGTKVTFEGYPRSFWKLPAVENLLGMAMIKSYQPLLMKIKADLESRQTQTV